MRFRHSPDIWDTYPTLSAGVVYAGGITRDVDVRGRLVAYASTARGRLAEQPISELPEIQAWRRTFAAMGLKPTQYRCASEALLRRLQKEGGFPSIHPLVDLCNHLSASCAIPVAVLDLARVTGDLEVRPANGTEQYLSFAGDIEHPEAGEVIFADDAGQAHARRWTNRQSAASAIRAETTDVLIVAEAHHAAGAQDVSSLIATIAAEIARAWQIEPTSARLSADDPDFLTPAG